MESVWCLPRKLEFSFLGYCVKSETTRKAVSDWINIISVSPRERSDTFKWGGWWSVWLRGHL